MWGYIYKAVGNAVTRIQPEMQSKSMAIELYGSFIAGQASIRNTSSQLLANSCSELISERKLAG